MSALPFIIYNSENKTNKFLFHSRFIIASKKKTAFDSAAQKKMCRINIATNKYTQNKLPQTISYLLDIVRIIQIAPGLPEFRKFDPLKLSNCIQNYAFFVPRCYISGNNGSRRWEPWIAQFSIQTKIIMMRRRRNVHLQYLK